MTDADAEVKRGLPGAAYHADPALSCGTVIAAHTLSWQHAGLDLAREGERQATPAMVEGALFHALVLEPGEVCGRYTVRPAALNARANSGKAWIADARDRGLEVVTQDVMDRCCRMRDAVLAHPTAGAMLRDATEREVSLWWRDPMGVRRKARPDAIAPGVVIDLKRSDATPRGFERAAATHRHDMRAAWYLDGVEAAGLGACRYCYVVVEPEHPHGVACYRIAEDDLDLARFRIDQLIGEYRALLEAGEPWPGYPVEERVISMPPYARIDLEVDDVIDWE